MYRCCRDGAKKITRQGIAKGPVAVAQPRFIGGNPSVKCFRHDLDPPPNPKIANPQLPQLAVHVGEHRVVEALRQAVCNLPFVAQAVQ